MFFSAELLNSKSPLCQIWCGERALALFEVHPKSPQSR